MLVDGGLVCRDPPTPAPRPPLGLPSPAHRPQSPSACQPSRAAPGRTSPGPPTKAGASDARATHARSGFSENQTTSYCEGLSGCNPRSMLIGRVGGLPKSALFPYALQRDFGVRGTTLDLWLLVMVLFGPDTELLCSLANSGGSNMSDSSAAAPKSIGGAHHRATDSCVALRSLVPNQLLIALCSRRLGGERSPEGLGSDGTGLGPYERGIF